MALTPTIHDPGFGHFHGCPAPDCDGSCYDDHANLIGARWAVNSYRESILKTSGGEPDWADAFWAKVHAVQSESLHRPPTFEAFLADCQAEWALAPRAARDLGGRA